MGITVWEGQFELFGHDARGRVRLKPAQREPREDGRYELQIFDDDTGKFLPVRDLSEREQAMVIALGRTGRSVPKLIRHAAAWLAEHPPTLVTHPGIELRPQIQHVDMVALLLRLATKVEIGTADAHDMPEFAGYSDVLAWADRRGHLPAHLTEAA